MADRQWLAEELATIAPLVRLMAKGLVEWTEPGLGSVKRGLSPKAAGLYPTKAGLGEYGSVQVPSILEAYNRDWDTNVGNSAWTTTSVVVELEVTTRS